jgi:DNA-binding CsgD family transcriptional regulator
MLKFIEFSQPIVRDTQLVPELFRPLLDAAREGRDLVPVVRSIVKCLGFDSFMCGFSTVLRPDRTSTLYVFTTLPREWVQLYDEQAYIEVDPRIPLVYDRTTTMVVWNAREFRGQSPEVDQFLNDAGKYGVRSGACFGLPDDHQNGVLVCYNSSSEEVQLELVERNLGALLSFGTYFHEVFLRTVVENGIPSRLRGATLTKRELQVLGLVARGLTYNDISVKLSVAPRTVKFHVDSARTKMCALNRQEAVALAVKAGLFDVLP